jgi:hypothetical protein
VRYVDGEIIGEGVASAPEEDSTGDERDERDGVKKQTAKEERRE